MQYAIISVGGKQYRVREGERLLVDRVSADEGSAFTPDVRLLARDGDVDLSPSGDTVTARVVAHVRGEKLRIGKYRRRTGYRRHVGFRSSLTQIEIESIGAQRGRAKPRRDAADEKPADKPEPAAEAQDAAASPAGAVPKGYDDMTIPQLRDAAQAWDTAQLEAALAYEREHAKRKGAVATLEAALAGKQEA